MKPVGGRVGVMYGRFSSAGTESMTMRFTQPRLGAFGLGVSLPYILQATPVAQEVCLPALTGKITVTPNSQRLVIPAQTFTPIDRQIIVRNRKLNRDYLLPAQCRGVSIPRRRDGYGRVPGHGD